MNKKVCLVFYLVLGIVSPLYLRFCAILSVCMQNSRTKIKNCANFSDDPVHKRLDTIESLFFAVMLSGPSASKKCFMFTLTKHQILVKPRKTLV